MTGLSVGAVAFSSLFALERAGGERWGIWEEWNELAESHL